MTRRCSLTRSPRPSLQRLEDRTVPALAAVGDLVVFGDSLADVGNASAATGGVLPPAALYFQGRFSGGPIWVDTLAEAVGEPPLRPSVLGGLDYAFGGATLSANSFFGAPKVGTQVDQYLAAHTPAKNDLFAFWAGANDFFSDSKISPPVPAAALADQVRELAAAGARNFVVNELPPLGRVPYFQDLKAAGFLNDAAIAGINAWSAAFNDALAADLAEVKADFRKVVIVTVGTEALFESWARPDNAPGFTDWTHAVGTYDPREGRGGLLLDIDAANPDDYLFYDSVHPGTRAHQLAGLEAAAGVLEALHVNHLKVTTTADAVNPLDGGMSLREALALADAMGGRQAVTFDLPAGAKTVRLGGSALTVGDDLTLTGRPGLTVSGEGDSRILDVSAGARVSLSGLRLVNGDADRGGAIRNAGDLTLTGVTLANNRAAQGGAIYNTGTLRVTASSVVANTASGVGAAGGGIATAGAGSRTHLVGVLVANNAAVGGPLAVGGGLAALDGAWLRVELSGVVGNRAAGGPDGSGHGGGVYAGAGSTVALIDAVLAGNAALGDGDGEGLGGGAYAAGDSVFRTRGARFFFNFASTDGDDVFRE